MLKIVAILQSKKKKYKNINYYDKIILIDNTIKYFYSFTKFDTLFAEKLFAFFVNILSQKSFKSISNTFIIKFYIEITKNTTRLKNK